MLPTCRPNFDYTTHNLEQACLREHLCHHIPSTNSVLKTLIDLIRKFEV
jgi:hypothetical protein